MLEKQSLSMKRIEAQDFYTHYHYHDEVQINMIEKGRGTLFIGSSIHPFSEGDVLMIGPNTPHLMQKSPDFDSAIIVNSFYFHPNLFGLNRLFEGELKEIDHFLDQSKKGILIDNNNASELWELKKEGHPEDGLTQIIFLLRIINQLKTNNSKVWLNDRSPRLDIDEDLGQRLDAVYQYTIKNLKKNISLDDVAAVANLSVSRFCAVFKKHADTTYIDFLNQLRVEEICFQLTHTDRSISEIAYESGFRNLSNFNKTFKSIKSKSPSQFRKMVLQLN